MQRSIRYQMVALVGLMLISALTTYLLLEHRIVTQDKLTSLKATGRLLTHAAAAQVDANVRTLRLKLYLVSQEKLVPESLAGEESLVAVQFVNTRNANGIFWKSSNAPRTLSLVRTEALQPSLNEVKLSAFEEQGTPLRRIALALSKDTWALVITTPNALLQFPTRHPFHLSLLSAASEVVNTTDTTGIPSGASALKELITNGPPTGEAEYVRNNETWLASWERLPSGLTVFAEVPKSEASKASRVLMAQAVFFGALMVGFSVMLAVYFSRRVSAPLEELQRTIERMARGELGVEVRVRASDEIGALAQSFNQMSRELARRSEELDIKNQQLVQSEKLSAIGELSAGLAHEVKNPMVGIVGFAQLGQESTSLDEAREYFKLIDNDAQRANGILQNLLEFARPPEVDHELLNFNTVVEGAVRLTAHQLQLNGVKVQTKYAAELPKVRGNLNQLRQVLLNLMMNASQAMDGQTQKTLYVTTIGGDAGAQVSVRDTGPGISNEAKAHIFEPFFTTKPRGKGTGLGLSVSKSIIEAHNGEIRVESELGAGATFFIRLPKAIENPDVSGPFRIPKV